METGIYPGTDRNDYEKIDAVNQSTLKLFKRTPAHARCALQNPKETKVLDFGTAFHKSILEPEQFEIDYVVPPKCDKRTKIGKEQWSDFQALFSDKSYVMEDEMKQIKGMTESLYGHKVVSEILKNKGQNEVCAVWNDKDTGMKCKALIDRVTTFAGWTVLPDVKTCENADEFDFKRSCTKYGYYIQAAFYLDGLNTIAEHERRFWLIAIEKTPPYGCQIYELDDDSIAQGQEEYKKYMKIYKECLDTNVWKSYCEGVIPLRLPEYKLRRVD